MPFPDKDPGGAPREWGATDGFQGWEKMFQWSSLRFPKRVLGVCLCVCVGMHACEKCSICLVNMPLSVYVAIETQLVPLDLNSLLLNWLKNSGHGQFTWTRHLSQICVKTAVINCFSNSPSCFIICLAYKTRSPFGHYLLLPSICLCSRMLMKIPLSAIHQMFETRSITQSTLGAFLSTVASSNSLISFFASWSVLRHVASHSFHCKLWHKNRSFIRRNTNILFS